MSEGAGVKYGCRCGETVFDLSGRATGDVLTCPFCKRQYFYWGASQIELLDTPIDTAAPGAYRADVHAKSSAGGASNVAAAAEPSRREGEAAARAQPDGAAGAEHARPDGKPAESAKPIEARADEPKRNAPDRERAGAQGESDADVPGGPRRRRFYEIQKADAPERPASPPKPAGECVRGITATSGRGGVAAPPRKRLFFLPDTSKPIPGGFFPMVACILGGNIVAFLVLYALLPADPDGTRLAPWGTIPKSAIWPELAAIVAGHLLGFAVWAVFVGVWVRRQRAQSRAAGRP
ncbi:MAG: hypothetical protein HY291_15410 [Planctomycetes bacterium]|nr:hypothetical protein [Planctomycetota bacterium]